MKDGHGRQIDYIRISVTDRCNLRCVYCMPEDGIALAKHQDILTFDEILSICKVLASLGFKKVKLTGGEPLVRKNLPELVYAIKNIAGIEKVTLTTNGVLLEEYLPSLMSAGIDGLNISLDTLDPDTFAAITRRDEFAKVWSAIQKVLEQADLPLKINCVPIEMEEKGILSIATLAKDYPIHVRFIEMMPIGYGRNYPFLGEQEICATLRQAYGTLKPYEGFLGNGPAHYYSIEGFQGKIGFISSISHKFCKQCNRIRLTSQGYLKTCLQYDTGTDLRSILRNGGDDNALKEAIVAALHQKPLEHDFLSENKVSKESKIMSQIGG